MKKTESKSKETTNWSRKNLLGITMKKLERRSGWRRDMAFPGGCFVGDRLVGDLRQVRGETGLRGDNFEGLSNGREETRINIYGAQLMFFT